jgi:hypothetical protein
LRRERPPADHLSGVPCLAPRGASGTVSEVRVPGEIRGRFAPCRAPRVSPAPPRGCNARVSCSELGMVSLKCNRVADKPPLSRSRLCDRRGPRLRSEPIEGSTLSQRRPEQERRHDGLKT